MDSRLALEIAIRRMVNIYTTRTGAGNDEVVAVSENRRAVRLELSEALSNSLGLPVSVPRITMDGGDITLVIHRIGPIENHIP